MESAILESHFGVPEHFIRAYTRNRCSENFVEIIIEIATILYPDIEFEVYLSPPEPGSYKDIINIVKKKPLESITAAATVGALAFGFLTYLDSHQEHIHTTNIQIVDDTTKCLSLKQQIDELSTKYEIENIPNEKIDEICGNLKLKKLKNDRFRALQDDDMIASDETILKDANAKVISQKKIERRDFEKHIEAIPEEEDYSRENLEGVIELVSLVVKQKKEGKGIPWKGIYYGNDIRERGVDILLNGEEISFYMQDTDFKKKIDEHQVTFTSGDTMGILFDIKGSLKIDLIQYKSIYVKEVKRFNEDVIEHIVKKKKKRNKTIDSDNQITLL